MQENKEYRRVSVLGWIGTLILSSIPGVNLILWIIWAFAAKCPSRKTFAIALLILTAFCVVVSAVCVSIWGMQMLEWARSIDPEIFIFTSVVGA